MNACESSKPESLAGYDTDDPGQIATKPRSITGKQNTERSIEPGPGCIAAAYAVLAIKHSVTVAGADAFRVTASTCRMYHQEGG